MSFSPASPTSVQKIDISIVAYSGIPDDASIPTLTKSVVGDVISISGAYVNCRCSHLGAPAFVNTSLEPLAAGRYTVNFTASADPSYGPSGWVLGPNGWVQAPILISATLDVVAAAAGQVARLEIVSGDRQIIVNSNAPNQPYVVRAVDVGGEPVQGTALVIQTSGGGDGVELRDEFGFRGFNTPGEGAPRPIGPAPEYLATTDATGLAVGSGHYVDIPPSAFLVGASNYGPQDAFPPVFFSAVMIASPAPGNPTVVVEYFDADFGHFFNTSYQTEIDALEANRFPGWYRSIGSFIAYASAADAPAGAVPVCRFFSSQFTSHFYTADAGECAAVTAKWPNIWALETATAFYILLPDKTTGVCGPGLQPIYRLYNNLPSPNHRYVTDRKLRDAMVISGWLPEGYGPDSVIMCTPK